MPGGSRADFCGEDKARLCPAHICPQRSEMFRSQQGTEPPAWAQPRAGMGNPPDVLPWPFGTFGTCPHLLEMILSDLTSVLRLQDVELDVMVPVDGSHSALVCRAMILRCVIPAPGPMRPSREEQPT